MLTAAHQPVAVWAFAVIFGFSMGADYMLIPLVVAECFGAASLGKLLALIIMGYSLGQWGAPWMAGRIFDARHSYDLAWKLMAGWGGGGGGGAFLISPLFPPPPGLNKNKDGWRRADIGVSAWRV